MEPFASNYENKESSLVTSKVRRFASDDQPPPSKIWKGVRYKTWSPEALHPSTKFKKTSDKEMTEVNRFLLFELFILEIKINSFFLIINILFHYKYKNLY